jgi:hypothetical protein
MPQAQLPRFEYGTGRAILRGAGAVFVSYETRRPKREGCPNGSGLVVQSPLAISDITPRLHGDHSTRIATKGIVAGDSNPHVGEDGAAASALNQLRWVRPLPSGGAPKKGAVIRQRRRGGGMAWRTVEQRLAEAQLRTARLETVLKKSLRARDARKKIVIAGAMLAEARDDGSLQERMKEIARRRVTRPEDVAVIAEWLSTT